MTNHLVSVVMITFGHEKYIEESINGVLSQVLEGKIELLISDDCSPDDTERIVNKIIAEHPNGSWIKYIKHSENKGAIPNFAWSISQAKGKYIAICEGDDYWTDPLKLQKQIDFLDHNKDYSICFHHVDEVDENGKLISEKIIQSEIEEKEYTIDDLSKGNFIHTPSVVFRKNVQTLPDFFIFSPLGDYPLHMINASYGKIKYFPDTMAVYRVGAGIWSSQTRIFKVINTLFTLKLLISYFYSATEIKKELTGQYNHLIEELESLKNSPVQSHENIAYNLPLKKLFIIILKKIKHLLS
ncbi:MULTISPECIES: glycosyltransferase family 2 protein [Chryseobacterium]|uniref:Putative glycosyl transferase n=1 Tax=Chryseobacterium taihuense TaxID=1141221 RepID=A0A4U8WDZ1_9FLAO|nr:MULTISPECIES: glycosyltransferase [Chryseobacterium]QQV02136.1 glycosyltransferase [Chryseobacterium sp. FDAARGOS 1104]VFB04631.1 putative glycosyl transferase [Chryseobacterium taihuense]